MVGIFSRFGVPRAGVHHQHTRSASTYAEERKASLLAANKETVAPSELTRGVVPMEEFVPVDHPMEPFDDDPPVRCPPPEPCIIHDGRIWKERLQLSMKQRGDLPFVREGGTALCDLPRRRLPSSSEHLIHPSMSAPEKTLHKLLD